MTKADKVMNPQHVGSDDSADIQILINPKIRIWIPNHFWLRLWTWHSFAFSEHSLVIIIIIISIYHYVRDGFDIERKDTDDWARKCTAFDAEGRRRNLAEGTPVKHEVDAREGYDSGGSDKSIKCMWNHYKWKIKIM